MHKLFKKNKNKELEKSSHIFFEKLQGEGNNSEQNKMLVALFQALNQLDMEYMMLPKTAEQQTQIKTAKKLITYICDNKKYEAVGLTFQPIETIGEVPGIDNRKLFDYFELSAFKPFSPQPH